MLKHTMARADWRDKNIAQKGFTLIELLVVILILGILAAVVVIAVANLTDNAQKKSCTTGARQIRTAVEAYRATWDNATSEPDLDKLNPYLDGKQSDITRDFELKYDPTEKFPIVEGKSGTDAKCTGTKVPE